MRMKFWSLDFLFFIHYNKQAMRDYYKIAHAEWLGAVGEAKNDARVEGVPFVDLLRSRQASGDVPEDPEVDGDFLSIQVEKMNLIKDCILGRKDGADVTQALEDCGRREVAFYTAANWRGDLLKLNGLD